jgi:hypothetical protein
VALFRRDPNFFSARVSNGAHIPGIVFDGLPTDNVGFERIPGTSDQLQCRSVMEGAPVAEEDVAEGNPFSARANQ